MAEAGPRVLVVDDELNITELVAMALRYEGFTVNTAATGRDALAKVASFKPALVVLDVMLPGTSGMEALEEIRSDPSLRQLPVAILSNSELTPEVHARAVDLGILGWLTKSRTPPPLVVRTIRRWLAVKP